MKRGFTLVELSIVLVIIGLLIGGILAARSMTSAAKTVGFIKQIGSFDTAIAAFQSQYQSMPGDSKLLLGANDYGSQDNNEINHGFGADWTGEPSVFWPQLSLAGFMGDENRTKGYQWIITSGVAAASYAPFPFSSNLAPKAKLGNNASVLVWGQQAPDAFGGKLAVYYIISDCTPTVTNNPVVWAPNLICTNALTGTEAISIDSKLDDGKGSSGNVVTMTGVGNWATGWYAYYGGVGNPAVNAVPGNTVKYVMDIKIGAAGGDLK